MVKVLVDKSKVANYKYYVKYKIKDWSSMENYFIELIKNNWSIDPESWVYAQHVFIKTVARCDKSIFIFILSVFL